MSVEIDAILPKEYNAEISVVAPQGGGTGGGVPRDEFDLLDKKVDDEIERAKKAEQQNATAIQNEKERALSAETALGTKIQNASNSIATLNTTIINYNTRYNIASAVTKQQVIEDLLNKGTADKGVVVTYYAEDGWHTIQYKLNYYNPTQGVKESNWVELGGDTPIIQQTETVVEIAPNVLNVWEEEVAELDITLAEGKDNVINEYMFQFTSGETATTLVLPADIKWVAAPNIQANKTYQVSIINNLGVIGEFVNE